MKRFLFTTVCGLLFILGCTGLRQQIEERNTGLFALERNEYEANLRSQAGQPPLQPKREFRLDTANMSIPDSTRTFRSVWHTPPISQDLTGSCWSFAATSFFESEVFRLSARKVKISEM